MMPVTADNTEETGAAAGLPPGLAPGGVRMQRLRAGAAGEFLFLVPGLEGDPDELADLVSAFTGTQDVYAVAPLPGGARAETGSGGAEHPPRLPVDGPGQPAGMAGMAELMVAAIRRLQPSGPYRLGGYSFGGLLALEMAQQLRAVGETVEALFLVDAVYDERYWPRRIWLRALARRTAWQLMRIARMNPVRAAGELRLRGGRLARRVMRRRSDAPPPLPLDASGAAVMVAQALSAIGGYRPRFYGGAMMLVASTEDRHFGCDTVRIWSGYAERIEVQRVEGDHLTVMQEPASAAAVAGVLDRRLAMLREGWAGLRPEAGFERPMILTTMRWFSAARLAHALTEAGFAVSACRPRAHALELVEGLHSDCRLRRVWRMRSLVRAIRRAAPDIILPDDERAVLLLRRLYARVRAADTGTAALIARSLGAVENWPEIASRTALAVRARALDIAAPETDVVGSAEALDTWAAGRSMPVVLKTDGSWGGRGVAIVRDAAHLREAWRTVSSPPSLPRAAKRLVFNLEAGPLAAWARRARPVVNAQEFVKGREAVVTVACLRGEVRALVCLEVLLASEARGPAAAVRVIEHPAMAEAARRLVGHFGLSGFCGFDFVLTDTGEARLLELNPRITPTAYLLVDGDHARSRAIALFPAEAVLDAPAGTGVSTVLDVPVRAPSLVRHGRRMIQRRHRPVSRMARRLKQRLSPSRY